MSPFVRHCFRPSVCLSGSVSVVTMTLMLIYALSLSVSICQRQHQWTSNRRTKRMTIKRRVDVDDAASFCWYSVSHLLLLHNYAYLLVNRNINASESTHTQKHTHHRYTPAHCHKMNRLTNKTLGCEVCLLTSTLPPMTVRISRYTGTNFKKQCQCSLVEFVILIYST